MKLLHYERITVNILTISALVFLGVYSLPIIWPQLENGTPGKAIQAISIILWIVFAVDIFIRLILAEKRLKFLYTHPLDILSVALPMFRPLRVLRVLSVARHLMKGGLASGLRTVALATGFVIYLASIFILSIERGAVGSTINSFGDAVWWSVCTVTTVGYGDVYPVTVYGKFIAAALMFVGIALVGIITAAIAAWFVVEQRENTA